MKAIIIYRHGGLDQLVYDDVPEPEASAGQVVVEVKACALNYLDISARLGGGEGEPTALPHIGGADIAGIVAEVGEGVTGVQVGERVVVDPEIWCGRCEYCLSAQQSMCDNYALIGWDIHGGYAQYTKVPATNLRRVPEGCSLEEAATVPVVGKSAWRMLVTQAGLKPGEDVLVLGASGGVGSAGVQIAKLCGARVIATSSSEEKLRLIRELGADEVINYREAAFDEAVLELTGGRGVDVVFDTQAGDTWRKSLNCTAKGGRVVICSGMQGASPEEDLVTIWWKQLRVIGSTGGTPSDFAKVMGLFEQGRLSPVIDRIFPLEETRQAQERMVNRQHVGKIVLRI